MMRAAIIAIVLSSASVCSAEDAPPRWVKAKEQPEVWSAVRTILSGPAAGAVGGQAMAGASGYSRVILFDMGGTSTDVSLMDRAVGMVARLDEPDDGNFVAKHFRAELAQKRSMGMEEAAAARTSLYRVFGSRPGTYGAGVLPLIDSGSWGEVGDLVRAYEAWEVPHYWVIDPELESVKVYRLNDAGHYERVVELSTETAGASITSSLFPDLAISLAEVFAE